MVDKYDSLKSVLGIDLRELNEYKHSQRLKNEVIPQKKYKDAVVVTDELLDIRNKLKLSGWGGCRIVGYMSGEKNYKVKVKDDRQGKKPEISIITMEKDGRILHILQDKTKWVMQCMTSFLL